MSVCVSLSVSVRLQLDFSLILNIVLNDRFKQKLHKLILDTVPKVIVYNKNSLYVKNVKNN